MKKYVLGFMFSEDYSRVALIRKLKPADQAGRLNGIGGKIEPGEIPIASMVREFLEETGYNQLRWRHFCIFQGPGWVVYAFTCTGPVDELNSVTPEDIVVCNSSVWTREMIQNLSWLIPLALDGEVESATVTQVTPHDQIPKDRTTVERYLDPEKSAA